MVTNLGKKWESKLYSYILLTSLQAKILLYEVGRWVKVVGRRSTVKVVLKEYGVKVKEGDNEECETGER